jgi:carboxymethylenebutenolidase
MWNSFPTDGPAGVTAELTTYTGGGGDTVHAYVARPATAGQHPGLVVIHHLPGWDEFYQEFSERLAKHGYLVIAPDLYCRAGHGTPDDVAAKVRAQGGVHDDGAVADCEAARSWLLSQPECNGKVGVIGSCSGGRHALLVASRVQGFDAVADLWGGSVVSDGHANPARPVAPIEYTAQLDAPLLGIFGNDDKHPTPEQVDIHEAELQKHGKSYEFHRYDGAGHGFFAVDRPAYNVAAANDGWERIEQFFGTHLEA